MSPAVEDPIRQAIERVARREVWDEVKNAELIAHTPYLKLYEPYHAIDLSQTYPDGAPIVKVEHLDIDALLLRPTSLASFHAAMYFVDAYCARGNATPRLVLPLVPGSRQDRLNETGDYLFTLKSVAREINARHFPSVTVIDPHSDVTPALIDRCAVVHPDLTDAIHPIHGYSGVIAPDGGAEKRAARVALDFGISLFHGWKRRDVMDGRLAGFGIESLPRNPRTAQEEPPKKCHFLVVDDLCDAGGTFIGLASEIVNQNATADLYISHGLFTKGTDELLKHYGRIYTTDSTVGAKRGVTVIERCESLLLGRGTL